MSTEQLAQTVLVTYASRLGATRGVAEAIGATLTEAGARVDVQPVTGVSSLDGYRAVVLGSAIRGGAWLPEALEFLQAQRAALAKKPLAVFLVCMTLAMPKGEEYRPHVSSWLEPARAARPVSEGLFAGALEVSKIESLLDRLKFGLSVKMGVWEEGDHRDWAAIHAWAAALPPRLFR